MKPVTKDGPTGKNAPKAPVQGQSEIQRRYVLGHHVPAEPKPKKVGK